MAAGEKVYVADKQTVDEIRTMLLSSEIGLAVLKGLLINSAGEAETTAEEISALGNVLDIVKGSLADSTNGLGAIRTAVEGKAEEKAVTAVKSLLENSTYGLNALKNAITGRANETTVAAVKAMLENGTYGLNALKTAISNVGKFSSTTAGILQLKVKPTITGTINANEKKAEAHSPELKISGNGQIVFHKCVCNDNIYHTLNKDLLKFEDVIIDDRATYVDFRLNGGTTNTAINTEGLKFEFSKSFRCKVMLDVLSISASYTQETIPECNFGIYYYVQLR